MLDKSALVAVVLAICVRVASSIHCYECNSANNSMCLEPTIYDRETLVKFLPTTTCGSGIYAAEQPSFFCRKITQTILHKGYEAEVRVTRGCGWVRHHKECYKADNEDHLETVCQCFTDGCNGATGLKTVGVFGASLGVLMALGAQGAITAIL